MTFRLLDAIALGMMSVAVLGLAEPAQVTPGVKRMPFGKTREGQPVDLYTLTNANGMEVTITNYGGTVASLKTQDRKGKFADVVLGFETFDGYLGNEPYFGALIGRYGN